MVLWCSECANPPLIGSRCISCYVNRESRRLKISKFLWFIYNRDRFKRALQGRFLTIQEGLEPQDKQIMIDKLFKTGGDRRHRVHHSKEAKYTNLKKIEKIVNVVDKYALEARNGN